MRWRAGDPELERATREYLVLDDDHEPESPVLVALRTQDDGTWVLGFHVILNERFTMPDVEDFARRVRTFIEDEPVRLDTT